MDNHLRKIFNRMINHTKVEITKDYRNILGVDYLGRWFHIQNIDRNGNVTLLSVKGAIPLEGVNYKNLEV